MLIGKNSNVIEGPPGVEFLGEVPTAGFINGLELASAIGLSAGIAQHSDSPWLHFILDGVELYVAKKPYRHSASWDQINAAGAVFGSRTVTINGRIYKVRLLRSIPSGDRYTGGSVNSVFDPVGAYGSEWNRLMYPIHSTKHQNAQNPSPESGEGIQLGTLAQYTDTDLVVHSSGGNGSYSWCQETPSDNTGMRVIRGAAGVSFLGLYAASWVNSYTGWRPVLELVE